MKDFNLKTRVQMLKESIEIDPHFNISPILQAYLEGDFPVNNFFNYKYAGKENRLKYVGKNDKDASYKFVAANGEFITMEEEVMLKHLLNNVLIPEVNPNPKEKFTDLNNKVIDKFGKKVKVNECINHQDVFDQVRHCLNQKSAEDISLLMNELNCEPNENIDELVKVLSDRIVKNEFSIDQLKSMLNENKEIKSLAYNLGKTDFITKKRKSTENPYLRSEEVSYGDWAQGWSDAQDEAETEYDNNRKKTNESNSSSIESLLAADDVTSFTKEDLDKFNSLNMSEEDIAGIWVDNKINSKLALDEIIDGLVDVKPFDGFHGDAAALVLAVLSNDISKRDYQFLTDKYAFTISNEDYEKLDSTTYGDYFDISYEKVSQDPEKEETRVDQSNKFVKASQKKLNNGASLSGLDALAFINIDEDGAKKIIMFLNENNLSISIKKK